MKPKIKILMLISFSYLFIIPTAFAQNANNISATELSQLSYAEIDSLRDLNWAKRNFETAKIYINQGLKKSKTEFGEIDTIHAEYLNYLGVLYYMSSEFLKAEKPLRKAANIEKEIFGERHPRYLSAMNNVANLLSTLNKHESAEEILLEVVKIKKEILGEVHPEYAFALAGLAAVNHNMGRYEKAELFLFQTMEIYKQLYGPQSSKYISTLSELATVYKQSQKFEQAEPLYLQVLEIRRQEAGENHFVYAQALESLARLYMAKKQYEKSEKAYLQVNEIYKDVLEEKNNGYAEFLHSFGHLYSLMGKYELAEPLFIHSSKIIKNAFGEDHEHYAESLNALAVLYLSMRKYNLAEPLFFKSKEINKKVSGQTHYNYSNSLNNIGVLFKSMGKLDKAFAYCIAGIASNCDDFENTFPNLFYEGDSIANFSPADNPEKYPPNSCCTELSPTDFLKISQLKYFSAQAMQQSLSNLLKITKIQAELAPNDNSKLERHYNISKAAMLVNEQLRNNFSGKKNKLRILRDNAAFVKFGLEAASKLGQTSHFIEAFSFAEQNKSVLLTDAVKGNRARILGDLPDSLVFQENALQQKKDALKKKKYAAKTSEEKSKILDKENKLNLKISSFLKSLKDKYPKYHALKYENITVKTKDVQALLNEKNDASRVFCV